MYMKLLNNYKLYDKYRRIMNGKWGVKMWGNK